MRTYSIYIFDFDGTIADSSRDVWTSIEYALDLQGLCLPTCISEDCANLALSSSSIYQLIAGEHNEAEEREFAEQVRCHYRNLNSFKETKLYPGIDGLLLELAKTASCHLASNKAQKALLRLLEIKGWKHYFTSIQGSLPEGDMPKEKMIWNVLNNYSDTPPAYILYIGDSGLDVVAARKNKIDVAGVTYGDGDTAVLLAEGPDYVIQSSIQLYHQLLNKG